MVQGIARVGKVVIRTQMPNGIREKRSFLDVAYDGAFSAYATIEKRPVAFRKVGCMNAS